MRFGDALCAAMHDGKWISSVVVTDQRLAKAGIRTVRERVAFCFNVKTSLWDAAVWYPGKAWRNLVNSTRTPDACPLLPAAKEAFVRGLTVPSGVVIDRREVSR